MYRTSLLLFVWVLAFSSGTSVKGALATEASSDMKHVGNLLALFEAQRELVQTNFPYLEAIGRDLARSSAQLLQSSSRNHPPALLNEVRGLALQFADEARAQDVGLFKTGNRIHTRCQECHTSPTPGSAPAWDNISQTCNAPFRNPYLCRSMHAMVTYLHYLQSAQENEDQDYDLLEPATKEFVRIAQDLRLKKARHGKEGVLERLENEGAAIALAAVQHDPAAFRKGVALRAVCEECHRPNGPD